MKKYMHQCWILGLFLILSVPPGFAQPGPNQGYQCPGCQAEYPNGQVLAEIISDLLEISTGMVSVVQGDDPNVYTITLPDGTTVSVAPVGPTFRYQRAVERRVQQTEDGGFRLRSQSRAELQLRSAIYQEAELVGELLHLGWTNFYWFRNGWEVDSPAGQRYCFSPDLVLSNVSPPGTIQVTMDDDGNLIVTHVDGIQQRLYACAHDFFQLRDQIRSTVQQELMLNSDGTFQLSLGEQIFRFRLSAELAWSDDPDHPGFYTEGDRILLRYRDGWEQEVLLLE